jgi:hypothetical protein
MRRADARRHRRVRGTANTQYDVVGVDSPDPEFNSRFAERLAAVSDVTGDGVPDVARDDGFLLTSDDKNSPGC